MQQMNCDRDEFTHYFGLDRCFLVALARSSSNFPEVHDLARFTGRSVPNSPKCTANPEDFANNGQNSSKCTIFSDFFAYNRAKQRIWNIICVSTRFLRAKQRIWLSEIQKYCEIVQSSKFGSPHTFAAFPGCTRAGGQHLPRPASC
ncbi:MAG TPA: hypothetical protein GX688_03975 [Clostridiales bacterium]|nr:hypothetical protein [Clostridiales bacterium]